MHGEFSTQDLEKKVFKIKSIKNNKPEILICFLEMLLETLDIKSYLSLPHNFAYLQIFNSIPELVLRPQITCLEIGLR